MNKNIIIRYINLVTRSDFESFINKENIYLNNEEKDYLFYLLKNRYNEFLENNELILSEIKNNINEKGFIKLYDLYIEYKKYL